MSNLRLGLVAFLLSTLVTYFGPHIYIGFGFLKSFIILVILLFPVFLILKKVSGLKNGELFVNILGLISLILIVLMFSFLYMLSQGLKGSQ